MFIEARLQTATRPAALVIPEDAVSPFAGAMYVWVIQDAKARAKWSWGCGRPAIEIQKPGAGRTGGGGQHRPAPARRRSPDHVVDRDPRGR